MIQVKCPSCGKGYKLPDNTAGKKTRCKACGEVIEIPGLAAAALSKAPPVSAPTHPVAPPTAPQPPSAGDPTIFNPGVSFSHSTSTRKTSAPLPTKLIVGAAGGGVGLLLIIVLVVVLIGGAGDKKDDSTQSGGLSLGGPSSPSSTNTKSNTPTKDPVVGDRPGNEETPGTGDPKTTDSTDPQDPVVVIDDPEPVDTYAKAMDDLFRVDTDKFMVHRPPADDKELVDWTTAAPAGFKPSERDSFRNMGIVIGLPKYWQNFPGMNMDKRTTEGYFASENGANRVLVFSTLSSEKTVDWPFLISPREGASGIRSSNSMTKRADGYLLTRKNVQVSFGTLMGGYRFIRIESLDEKKFANKPARQVEYVGYVGDVLMHFTLKDAEGDDITLEDLEQYVRSARLMTPQELDAYANDDSSRKTHLNGRWKGWLADPEVKIADSGTAPPVDIGTLVGPIDRPNPDTPDQVADKPKPRDPGELSRPTGAAFGIELPAVFEEASQTRIAMRAKPLGDGTWLSMEVHKLQALHRRWASPVAGDGASLLLRGRYVALPAGVQVTSIKSEHYDVIHRLHYPELPGQDVRRVEYVVKDGPYLITVLGRYPSKDPERLAELDAAVLTVQPSPLGVEEDG